MQTCRAAYAVRESLDDPKRANVSQKARTFNFAPLSGNAAPKLVRGSRIRGTETIEYRPASRPALLSLHVGRADNLAPLLGFCSTEFSELGRGRPDHRATPAA